MTEPILVAPFVVSGVAGVLLALSMPVPMAVLISGVVMMVTFPLAMAIAYSRLE